MSSASVKLGSSFRFLDTGSLYSHSWPGTFYVDQAVLELTENLLSLPPKCWDQRRASPHLALKEAAMKLFTCFLVNSPLESLRDVPPDRRPERAACFTCD